MVIINWTAFIFFAADSHFVTGTSISIESSRVSFDRFTFSVIENEVQLGLFVEQVTFCFFAGYGPILAALTGKSHQSLLKRR